MDQDVYDQAASFASVCAACDLTARLSGDLASARSALSMAEIDMNRAIDLVFAGRADYPLELATRVRHDRTRVDALEQVLADLRAGHGGCDAA